MKGTTFIWAIAMSGATLSTCETGLTVIENALIEKGWSKQMLASKTIPPDRDGQCFGEPISYKTVQIFFNGKPISLRVFHAICASLDVDWQVVAGRVARAEETEEKQTEEFAEVGSRIVQNISQNNGKVFGQVTSNISL